MHLTDIENRRGWQSTIDEEAERSDRNGADLCVPAHTLIGPAGPRPFQEIQRPERPSGRRRPAPGHDQVLEGPSFAPATTSRYGGEEFVVQPRRHLPRRGSRNHRPASQVHPGQHRLFGRRSPTPAQRRSVNRSPRNALTRPCTGQSRTGATAPGLPEPTCPDPLNPQATTGARACRSAAVPAQSTSIPARMSSVS